MVTGVSHSLFYKLCLLAELHRCWKTSLWLIKKSYMSYHIYLMLAVKMGEVGQDEKKQLLFFCFV